MHSWIRGSAGALLAAALTGSAAKAAAADPQVVRMLSFGKNPKNASYQVRFDRDPPAGEEFIIELRLRDFPRLLGAEASGRLDVWPAVESPCEQPPEAKRRVKQHHALGMTLAGEGAEAALSARVPALQVGQTFCFAVDVRARLEEAALLEIAQAAAGKMARDLLAAPDCREGASAAAFQEAMEGALKRAGYQAAVSSKSAARAAARFAMDGAAACDDAQRADSPVSRRAAEGSLQRRLAAALLIEEVRRDVDVAVAAVARARQTGQATTPSAANYASLDMGAVVALPSGGDTLEPWVLPYLAVNLYFTPVDRNIPLEDLVGPTIRQRFSLTLGATLTTPSLPGRTLEPVFLGAYPVAALGFRFTHYIRGTGGAVLYQLRDRNPASAGTSLAAAPFVGASLDIDLVKFIDDQRKR